MRKHNYKNLASLTGLLFYYIICLALKSITSEIEIIYVTSVLHISPTAFFLTKMCKVNDSSGFYNHSTENKIKIIGKKNKCFVLDS